ncbi:hypothetical protein [Actinophytocola gossypii]|uniref:PE domain-containing protein n=1 Tax=Actinophytocola gossypii TaxID=2812003 RepID=A0ABT2JFJ7_9PSEU|nr:hypothetical protein [Actinophytocola gossypii]MCT2586647.1 hypothetical protein [Actinophytocola gossypii]
MGANADRMHMDVDAVLHHMAQVADVGQEIATAWAVRRQELEALEPGIGSGVIGSAIRAAYRVPSQQVSDAVTKIPELYAAMSEAGRSAVNEYVAADQAGAAGIAKATPDVDPRTL